MAGLLDNRRQSSVPRGHRRLRLRPQPRPARYDGIEMGRKPLSAWNRRPAAAGHGESSAVGGVVRAPDVHRRLFDERALLARLRDATRVVDRFLTLCDFAGFLATAFLVVFFFGSEVLARALRAAFLAGVRLAPKVALVALLRLVRFVPIGFLMVRIGLAIRRRLLTAVLRLRRDLG